MLPEAPPAPPRLDGSRVVDLLRQYRISPTRQRIEIASILLARPQHVCADALLALVNEGAVRVSKATVYNNLRLFARRGLVREVIVDPIKVFFDSNAAPHSHIYNVDSGLLIDVAPDAMDVRCLPVLPEGTEVAGIDVIVRVRNQAR